MSSKIKNIIIFVVITAIFVLIYIFFIKPKPEEVGLVSSNTTALPAANNTNTGTNTASGAILVATEDFLPLLLNVKKISLDDKILSEQVFNSLHDSSIILVPDGKEGRSNPFAQFGNDSVSSGNSSSSSTSTSSSSNSNATSL